MSFADVCVHGCVQSKDMINTWPGLLSSLLIGTLPYRLICSLWSLSFKAWPLVQMCCHFVSNFLNFLFIIAVFFARLRLVSVLSRHFLFYFDILLTFLSFQVTPSSDQISPLFPHAPCYHVSLRSLRLSALCQSIFIRTPCPASSPSHSLWLIQ